MDEKRKQRQKPKPLPDDEPQSKRFIEAAKQLEADETCRSFDDTFRIVAPSAQRTGPPSRKEKA